MASTVRSLADPGQQRGDADGGNQTAVLTLRSSLLVTGLADGAAVIVSDGGTVRVWRLADSYPVGEPLDLPLRYGLSPFTATSSSPRPEPTSLSTKQRSRHHALAAVVFPEQRPADETTG